MNDTAVAARHDPDAQRRADLAIAQMFRGLDRQATVLSELRQRANIVLSASGLIASLLGAEVIKGDYSHVLAAGALVATGAGMLLCVGVLRSVCDEGTLPAIDAKGDLTRAQREWKVTCSPEELELLARDPEGLKEVLSTMAIARAMNHETVDRRAKLFMLASLMLVLQLAFWAAAFIAHSW